MPVTIENQTATRVLLRLNSGRNWHLGPGEALEVEPVEVKGNAWIQRLEERRLIEVRRPETGEPETASTAPEEEAPPRPRRVR
jgi:hypothetical protein